MVLPYQTHTDAELCNLLYNGDEGAFNALFERYREKLYRYLLKITKSPEIAEEIVIDIFVKMWVGRELLKNVKSVEGFLLTVAKNKALDCLRTAARHSRLRKAYSDFFSAAPVKAADELLIDKEMTDIWLQAINQLPPRRREIFILSKEQGMSYDEIAKALHLSRNTVKNALAKARQSMADFLKDHPNGKAALCLFFVFT